MGNIFKKTKPLAHLIALVFLSLSLYNIINFVFSNKGLFIEQFNPEIHRKLYGQSQYVMKDPLSEIGDEIVYALSGWEYVHGLNPILLNGEQPPLGKYFIGLTELWFNNSRITAPVFNILLLIIFFLLADLVIESKVISSLLTYLFSFEKVFVAQMLYAPNLDNIQVFFLLLTFYFFVKYAKSTRQKYLVFTFISLGLVIAVKFWITGFIVFIVFLLFLILNKNKSGLKTFLLFSPLILIPLIFSYFKSFQDGMTIREFFGTQKYIYAWHSAKLVFDPVSFFDLIFLNKWHFMGKIQKSVDWQLTWPIFTTFSILTIVTFLRSLKEKLKVDQPICVVQIWLILYFGTLIVSTVNARYLFPILPAIYISSGWLLKEVIKSKRGEN